MLETTLPPYTGPDTECPKCGHDAATTTFVGTGRCGGDSHDFIQNSHGLDNPRLCRRCKRCDYAWDEACVAEPVTPRTDPPVDKGDAIAAVVHNDPRRRPPATPGMGSTIANIVLHEDPSPGLRRLREDADLARATAIPRVRGTWG